MSSPTDIERLTTLVLQQKQKTVRVKEGQTNGMPVLHVFDSTGNSRTIKNSADWVFAPNVLNADNKHIEEEIA